jgi:large subunit ribosomal protein L3
MIGLIGRKIGMTQVFDEDGVLTPVTVVHFEPNVVVSERKAEKDGYDAVVIGSGEMKKSRVTKPYAGQFPEGVRPTKHVMELRDFDAEYAVGGSLGVELFDGHGYVDVVGTTKGKGYQGVMRRHGFHGGRKSHGSKFHRAPGSTGQAAWPSKVIKGRKMPGRMGAERRTVQNLRIVKIDPDKQVLLVGGTVPGARDSMVLVRDAKKR